MAFADNLKQLRTQKNVSQQEIADCLATTRQAYNNYETGKREPNFSTLIRIADFLEVTIDELLREKEPECVSTFEQEEIKNTTTNQTNTFIQTLKTILTFAENSYSSGLDELGKLEGYVIAKIEDLEVKHNVKSNKN